MNQPTISIVDDDNNRSVLCDTLGGKNADYDEYFLKPWPVRECGDRLKRFV